jgi:hypothetical protein
MRVIGSGEARAERLEPAHGLDGYVQVLRNLHEECKGNRVRVREELKKRHRVETPYTTLTRYCRVAGIGVVTKEPSCRIVTGPGEEMQHDTSPYTILIGGKKVKRQCASLVMGYSRRMYIRFTPTFDRFQCKAFLTEAFQYMGGACRVCVIDNSHVVIVCGTGANAQVSPEMEAFEKRFGFRFLAHALGHADRSGKVERPFWYIERNFLVGRTFKDDEDLNRQAAAWLEEKAHVRRLRELGASPQELFASEKPHLTPLPLYVPEVYRDFRREVDGYGYVRLHALRYSAPAKALGWTLTVRETPGHVLLLNGREELARHNKLTGDDGRHQSTLPGHKRRGRRPPAVPPEEALLKALGPVLGSYLGKMKSARGHRYVWSLKKLHALLCQYKSEDLLAAVAIAAQHGLFDVGRIERILLQNLARQEYLLPLGTEDYEKSPGYIEGSGTPPSDMSAYDVEIKSEDRGDDDAR